MVSVLQSWPTRVPVIDPKRSWEQFQQFQRHSELMNTRRQPKRKKKRRNKKAMLVKG